MLLVTGYYSKLLKKFEFGTIDKGHFSGQQVACLVLRSVFIPVNTESPQVRFG